MIEKIILAIVITFALAWNINLKPPQRAVAIIDPGSFTAEIESSFNAPIQYQTPVLLTF